MAEHSRLTPEEQRRHSSSRMLVRLILSGGAWMTLVLVAYQLWVIFGGLDHTTRTALLAFGIAALGFPVLMIVESIRSSLRRKGDERSSR